MDLEKIGKFITKKRQENNFTQESLAEKLDISNRSFFQEIQTIASTIVTGVIARICQGHGLIYRETEALGVSVSVVDHGLQVKDFMKLLGVVVPVGVAAAGTFVFRVALGAGGRGYDGISVVVAEGWGRVGRLRRAAAGTGPPGVAAAGAGGR